MTTTIDDLIKRYKDRLAKAEQIRDLIKGDSAFAEELLAVLQEAFSPNASPQIAPRAPATRATNLSRVRQYFQTRNNQWSTLPAVVKTTGLSRGAVAQTIYKAHPEAFEKKANPKHGRMKLWRLIETDKGDSQ